MDKSLPYVDDPVQDGADAAQPPETRDAELADEFEPAAPEDEGHSRPSVSTASAELKAILEALIFASPEPLTVKALRKLLHGETPEQIDTALAGLRQDYEHGRGLQLVEVAGGYQIVTRPELHEWVRRLFHERTTQKLSVQALETLAVIAYKQPITAAEIAEVRGVNTAGVLGTLVDRRLVKIAGRKPVVGRPFMYATTREFLDRFGLKDLTELPKIEDMAEALGFDPPGVASVADVALPFDADVERPETQA
jgi:segregation and condensation protein B